MTILKNNFNLLLLVLITACPINAYAEDVQQIEYPTYFANANDITIAYQDFGDKNDPVILLIMGLGGQLIHWDDDFVLSLVDAGYRVIRYDNRDIGMSEKLYRAPTPGFFELVRYKLGMSLNAPYLLDDMANDSTALLDHLGIKQAHVAGISMGGMIAQIMTAKHPEQILSLASIMSSSGAAHLPESPLKSEPRDRSDSSREEIIQETIIALKTIYAKQGLISDEEWYDFAARTYDRSHYDAGFSRQIWAILDSGDRVDLLNSIKQPTVVIHGKIDPLVDIAHGVHTAEMVEGSEFVIIEDMGHLMGVEHQTQILEAVLNNIKKAN